MQFEKKTRAGSISGIAKLLIKIVLFFLALLIVVVLIDRIDFPSPTKNTEKKIPNAITIQADNFKDYKNLIDVAKSNYADWIILQPLIKKNTTDEDCYKFFKKLIPLANETIVGIQNAKEYLGVGLSVKKIKKLSNLFPNFRVIKNES